MLENGRDQSFMERSTMTTAFSFVDSHIVGVRFSGTAAADRMTWSAGWFNDWLDDGLSFDQSGQVGAGRVTGLPIQANGGRRLFHLGASAAYREAPNGSFRLKSVPEVYEAPDFVDTGSFPASSGASIGGEAAWVEGPVTVSGECASTHVASPQAGDPHFSGYYVMASWMLTGEMRPYDHATGTLGRILPASPFSFRHGGAGAWELAASSWAQVVNIKRDPFETSIGQQYKTLMGMGGTLAGPYTAYLYDWNMLPIGQSLWLRELEMGPKSNFQPALAKA